MAQCEWEDFTGQILLGRYTLRSLLSAGQGQAEFAGYRVPPAEEEQPLSVTLIIPDEGELEQQLMQIQTARRLVHPNLLRILDGGQCTVQGTMLLFVVTETAAVTLAEVIAQGRLDSTDGTALIRDILSGLSYVRGSGFLCGGLQPETIVRAGDIWKIGDLSQLHPLSAFENGSAANSTTTAEASIQRLEPGMDTWALGTILRGSLAEEVRRIPVFDAVIERCLEPDPAKRISPEDISRLLDNPEAAPDSVLPEVASPDRQWAAFSPGSLLTIGIVAVATLMVFAVLATMVFRKRPTPAPANSTVAPAPARTASQSDSRPSPFSSNTAAKGSPQPQPHVPPSGTVPSGTVPSPTPQVTSSVESGTRSPSQDGVEGNVGRAAFFADNLTGQRTASGELFSNEAMTAAHASLPLGTKVRVTNLRNNKSVEVRINDRIPPSQSVTITVTRAAAEQLGFLDAGTARVKIEPVR